MGHTLSEGGVETIFSGKLKTTSSEEAEESAATGMAQGYKPAKEDSVTHHNEAFYTDNRKSHQISQSYKSFRYDTKIDPISFERSAGGWRSKGRVKFAVS